jgi:hypothetical protein
VSLETYLLVVPLVGLAITVPIWAYLFITRPRRPKAGE